MYLKKQSNLNFANRASAYAVTEATRLVIDRTFTKAWLSMCSQTSLPG